MANSTMTGPAFEGVGIRQRGRVGRARRAVSRSLRPSGRDVAGCPAGALRRACETSYAVTDDIVAGCEALVTAVGRGEGEIPPAAGALALLAYLDLAQWEHEEVSEGRRRRLPLPLRVRAERALEALVASLADGGAADGVEREALSRSARLEALVTSARDRREPVGRAGRIGGAAAAAA